MRSFTSFAAVCLVLVLCVGCATNTKRSDFDNECEYAKAKYQETQESARLYYALGTTSVAEIAGRFGAVVTAVGRFYPRAMQHWMSSVRRKPVVDLVR